MRRTSFVIALLTAAGCHSNDTTRSASPAPSSPAAQAAPAPAPSAAPATVDPFSAPAVLDRVHAIDREEIELGRLAASKAVNKLVKQFGRKMIKDHSKADKEVQELAAKEKVRLQDPSTLALPDADKAKLEADQKQVKRLQTETGATFDHDYLQTMVDGHKEALQFLQDAEANVSDAGVRDLVKKLQKAVRAHEELAQKDLDKIEKKKGNG